MVAAGYLKKLFALSDAETDRYIGMRTRGMPRKWSATTTGDYYGVYRHSGHYIRGGRGKNSVSWQVDIPEAGMYDVYFYVPEIRNPMDRSRGGGQQPSGQRPSSGQRSGGPGGQRGGAPGGQRAGGGSGGRPGQGRGDQKRDPIAEDFHFTVQREGGAEEVELDVDDVEYGWLFLGAYHYGIGSYTLELSDQTRGRMVYADAMKWVKNEQ